MSGDDRPDTRLGAALAQVPDPLALLEGLFAASPVAYQVYRADGHCLVVNQAFRDLFGSEPPPDYNVLQDDVAAERGVLGLIHRAFAGETVRVPPVWYDPRELKQLEVKEGRRVAIEATFFPLFDRDGRVGMVAIAFHDLTAVTLAREMLEAVIRATPMAVVVLDEQAIVRQWSPGAERIFGWTADEAIGSEFPPALPDHLDEARELFERLLRGERFDLIEIARSRKDGTAVDVAVSAAPFIGPDGHRHVVAVMADVTGQKRATDALRASEARLRVLADASQAFANTGLSPEQTIDTVARFVSETLGDACVASLAIRDGNALEAVAVHHPDPAMAPLFRAVFDRPFEIDEGLPGRVLRTGEPLIIPQFDLAEVPATARPETHAYFRAARPHSIALVPLRIRGRVGGALGIVRERPGPPYGPADLRLLQDLADRAALAIENAQLYRQAQLATRARDEFLGILSHELRTPLSSILGWASILRSAGDTGAQAARAIATVERNAQALARLVSDLLDTASIESGVLRLEPQPIDLVAVVRGALDTIQHAADAKGVALRFEPAAVVTFNGDPARIQQIVWNLLNNAVKFTPRGGRVEVEVRADPNHVTLIVRDTGEGIAPEFLPHVFERFRQADSSTTRRHGGLGLGLAIARQLTELHGGTIVAESEGPGHGSTFTVRLPVVVPHR